MASSSASATVAVDKATSDLLLGPDWTTNMEICDSVNSLHWQAKDVVKALKKRLQHKSPRVQQLALTLLEALVKNCGDYLHHQVAEKNILGEMVKIVKKKADMQVRDKILVMLDSWQQAFGGPEGKYPHYYWAYDELRRSGVVFPQRSPNASPIITPQVSLPAVRQPQGAYGSPQAGYGVPYAAYGAPQAGYGPPQAGYGVPPQAGYGIPQVGYGMPSGSSRRLDEAMASEVEGLSLSSIEAMRDVMDLLGDMLSAVDTSDRQAVKDEVIVDLVERCRSNQKKLMQMLTTTVDDELLGRGLDLNDSLQILLARHDAIASGSPLPVLALKPADSSPKSSEAKDSSSIAGSSSPVPATVSTGKSPVDEEDEEEDEFAQLARRHSKTPASVTTDPASSESHNALALALPDPPPPVNTTREQDMIDLLSLALTSAPPPPSSQPAPPPTVSDQNTHVYPQAVPQFESYVAPWAQPQQPQQQHPQAHQGYSQPQQPQTQQGYSQPQQPQTQQGYSQPQQIQTQQGYSQPQQIQTQQGYSHPQQQIQTHQGYSQPQQTQTQQGTHPQQQAQFQMQPQARPQSPFEYPPPPWASTSANAYYTPRANATASYTETSAGRTLQQSNSFPARTGDPQATSAASNPGVSGGQKPFVPSYRLFEDLDVFGSTEGKHNNKSTNSNNASQAQQSMIGGRKMI
ncbi:TOM1-like protein 6 isoform X2 [Brassica napus]|uniref:TOM1-like protein 6 isoform X2 n=1 Tax=Brassica napus TaxID=3708 RepID=UPI00207A5EAD|nr:TOM1-like protein 6 isoform X2 [Brassica napus]